MTLETCLLILSKPNDRPGIFKRRLVQVIKVASIFHFFTPLLLLYCNILTIANVVEYRCTGFLLSYKISILSNRYVLSEQRYPYPLLQYYWSLDSVDNWYLLCEWSKNALPPNAQPFRSVNYTGPRIERRTVSSIIHRHLPFLIYF